MLCPVEFYPGRIFVSPIMNGIEVPACVRRLELHHLQLPLFVPLPDDGRDIRAAHETFAKTIDAVIDMIE